MRKMILVVLALMLMACADKAKPDYEKCTADDQAGNFQHAWDDCHTAVAADPNSTDGKAAAALLASDKYVHWKKSEEERSAKAAASYAQAQQQAAAASLAALKHKLRAQVFSVEDDNCTGKGLPAHAIRFTNGTFQEIAAVAQSMGCQNPIPMSDVVRTWCCPTAQEL